MWEQSNMRGHPQSKGCVVHKLVNITGYKFTLPGLSPRVVWGGVPGCLLDTMGSVWDTHSKCMQISYPHPCPTPNCHWARDPGHTTFLSCHSSVTHVYSNSATKLLLPIGIFCFVSVFWLILLEGGGRALGEWLYISCVHSPSLTQPSSDLAKCQICGSEQAVVANHGFSQRVSLGTLWAVCQSWF